MPGKPVPSKVLLPGDVLVKAEKGAEEACRLARLPQHTSHHNEALSLAAKNFATLDKNLASIASRVSAMEETVKELKAQESKIRQHSENSLEVVELMKRIEAIK